MDRNYIERHLLVDRYIQGKLERGDHDEFEARLLWDNALVEEVQLAERLRDGLREVSVAQTNVADSPGFDLVAMVSGLFAVPQYAAAASFLLAVTLTVGVLMNPFVDLNGQSEVPALHTDIVPLFATRSEDSMAIAVDPDTWTVLLVDVMGAYPTYRVTIRRDETGADPIWVQDGLMPTYPDSLAVGMPGSALAAGRYVLTIEGVVADSGETTYERVQDIPFESIAVD